MEGVLNDATRSRCIDVTIHMDSVDEIAEDFCIELLYMNHSEGYLVVPNMLCVTIVDITGKCFRCLIY